MENWKITTWKVSLNFLIKESWSSPKIGINVLFKEARRVLCDEHVLNVICQNEIVFIWAIRLRKRFLHAVATSEVPTVFSLSDSLTNLNSFGLSQTLVLRTIKRAKQVTDFNFYIEYLSFIKRKQDIFGQ